jgi:ribokinase
MQEQPHIVVLGSLNADLVQSVERLPRPGETIPGGGMHIFPGGKGANQACAAARIGARVAMVGQVGDDNLASLLLDSLRSAGVDTRHVGVSGKSTGTAAILVLPDGENTIVISAGANATLTPEVALPRLERIGPGSLLLCQLEVPLETVGKALAYAKARGACTILDPAPARPLDPDLLQRVDFLTPNEIEAAVLLGRPADSLESDEDAREAARELLRLGTSAVVLTLGSRGCIVASGHDIQVVPGFAVAAVDTTGAGDTFNGAFACALAEGRELIEAARFANAAAALSVTRPGAQTSIPARVEVEAFLNRAA